MNDDNPSLMISALQHFAFCARHARQLDASLVENAVGDELEEDGYLQLTEEEVQHPTTGIGRIE